MAIERQRAPQPPTPALRRGGLFTLLLLFAFFVGWVTFTFALFDVGRFSITLLLLASCALSVTRFRLTVSLLSVILSLFLSSFIAWLISFITYSDSERTFTHMFQFMVALGVMTGTASINWEREWPRLRKVFAMLAFLVLAFGFYQIVARKQGLPFAFLPITNQQLGADEGLQRGFSHLYSGAGDFTRVSSFFAEPSDLGRFMLWAIAIGLACKAGRLRVFCLAVGAIGLLMSQSLGGLAGLVFLLGVVILVKRDVRGLVLSSVLLGVATIAFCLLWPEEAAAMLQRAELIFSGGRSYLDQTQRFGSVSEHLSIFLKSPLFGHGIASFRKVASPDSVVINGVMMLLIERGLFGSFLFLMPYFWTLLKLSRANLAQDEITRTALFILIVEIFCFSTFAMIYFPPSFFALGFAISRIRYRISNHAGDSKAKETSQLEAPQPC